MEHMNSTLLVVKIKECCPTKPDRISREIQLCELAMCQELTTLLSKPDVEIDFYFKTSIEYFKYLNLSSYESKFLRLSMIERITNQLELDKYHKDNVSVKPNLKDENGKILQYEIFIKNVKDEMGQLTEYDTIRFKLPDNPEFMVSASICHLQKHKIVFKPVKDLDIERRYSITFHLNQYTFDMESAAISLASHSKIVERLFPYKINPKLSTEEIKFDWINKDIIGNQLQMQAVRHIVKGTAHPAPYILFGPPGTGKTKTLVEAISQIHLLDSNSRILVCATSNAATDELALRIIQNLPNKCGISHHVYRIYSSSYSPKEPISTDLKNSSNFDLHYCPSLSFLDKFRIIVATPLVGGYLRYAGLDPFYFTHMFIDECGSATEISSLVPITCAANAHIVLSGDPKQLGPVVFSKHASDMGLGLSLLERLIETQFYQKDPTTKLHNANVLTKLSFNYRSHPSIISPLNRLFYDGDLIAKGDIKNTYCFGEWSYLPSAGTPIIFHASVQQSRRENNSKSIFNTKEIQVLMKYVKLIMKSSMSGKKVQQSDIGIISPYKKQCQKIEENLQRRNLRKIMVATVERFQGKEKPIILISTTRCKLGGIGFLRCPRRLNVMLTRAKCLMIIDGDPNTLKIDKNWREVLSEYKAAGVCTGVPFEIESRNPKSKNSKIGKTISSLTNNSKPNSVTAVKAQKNINFIRRNTNSTVTQAVVGSSIKPKTLDEQLSDVMIDEMILHLNKLKMKISKTMPEAI